MTILKSQLVLSPVSGQETGSKSVNDSVGKPLPITNGASGKSPTGLALMDVFVRVLLSDARMVVYSEGTWRDGCAERLMSLCF